MSYAFIIKDVVSALSRAEPVILPTDTLFALSVNATSEKAVSNLFEIKSRKLEKALPVFVSSFEQAEEFFEFNDLAMKLAKKFWPGPLTLILKLKGKLAKNLSISEKIAVRMPSSSLIMEIINNFGKPITGTSANPSGNNDIFDYQELLLTFKDKVPIIVNGEIQKNAKPSTVIDCSNNTVQFLRVGSISEDSILRLIS
ncbi:MAG: threonylcarbamoyl-AMP synthase [Candidatus Midichloria sp.]|nr:threonylcarbamoyl-AMP synthase [Candidatus Midichloria sp.]